MNSSSFATVNPATGGQIETFPFLTAGETEAALARAEKSFQSYRKLSVHQRAQQGQNRRQKHANSPRRNLPTSP
jgi:acyl-CoA reductase-like NAD-dependent aldehyde dehydrogenase